MKSIQMTALILWGIIFVVAAFILGQFLVSKDIFDITHLFTINDGEDSNNASLNGSETVDELENDVVIDKVGQETVRIGQNIAEDYFSEYYKEYINYIMADAEAYKENEKIAITDDLASDYIFYALSRGIDSDKYISEANGDKITISEGNLNSYIDKMFAKEVSNIYKEDANNGYNKVAKTYSITKNEKQAEYVQDLVNIENITSNQVKLEFECKKIAVNDNKTETADKKQVNIYVLYKGGRYILTDVEKIKK